MLLQVQPALLRLFQGWPLVHQVLAWGDDIPAHDVHCPLMSLPLKFQTGLHNMLPPVSYFNVSADSVQAMQQHLDAAQGKQQRFA